VIATGVLRGGSSVVHYSSAAGQSGVQTGASEGGALQCECRQWAYVGILLVTMSVAQQ
jgi:hypothetical protein